LDRGSGVVVVREEVVDEEDVLSSIGGEGGVRLGRFGTGLVVVVMPRSTGDGGAGGVGLGRMGTGLVLVVVPGSTGLGGDVLGA
jgi:hypothetical protein